MLASPPERLIAACGLYKAVVALTQRHGELVANLEPPRPWLKVLQMVYLDWSQPTDDTRLVSHETQMSLGADAPGLRDSEDGFVDLGFHAVSQHLGIKPPRN